LIAIMLVSTAGCDQLTKKVAKDELALSEPVSLLNDVIRLEYAENPGAFLSIGENLPGPVLLLFSSVLVGVVIFLLLKLSIQNRTVKAATLVGLSLMAGGSIGNLLDRLLNAGAVVDFISLGIGPIRSGIFNLADVAILTGAFFLLLSMNKKSGGVGAA
jgi:signal peptidase II